MIKKNSLQQTRHLRPPNLITVLAVFVFFVFLLEYARVYYQCSLHNVCSVEINQPLHVPERLAM